MNSKQLIVALLLPLCGSIAHAQQPSIRAVELAEGALAFEAPETWKTAPQRNNLIEREFSIAGPEGSDAGARLTIMAAGGSVDANLARWIGQFKNTEAGADRSGAEIDRTEANGMRVTLFDLSGVFLEGRPFGPKTPRPDYRMVAAIVETGGSGNYFFKLVGPEAAVDPAAEAFREAVLTIRKQ